MRYALALLAAATLALPAVAQTTYRWVDEQGKVHFSDQPPPQSIRQLEEKRYSAGTPDATPSYTVRKAAADFPVALYTSADCGEPCDTARMLLSARGIPFSEKVVRTEEDLAAYRKVFGSPDEVPALTVGSYTRKGFEPDGWMRLLDDAGYPRSPQPR